MIFVNAILQGTTPSLTITIPEEITVDEITALELTFKQAFGVSVHHLADVSLDIEDNTITYAFSEAETLALSPAAPLLWQLRIQTTDGIFGTPQNRINVLDLISQEAMS